VENTNNAVSLEVLLSFLAGSSTT